MAIKKTDNSKHKGLRGVWTDINAKDDLTGNNYLSIFTKGALGGAAMFSAMTVAQLGVISGLDYMSDRGEFNYTDLDMTTDENFNRDHRVAVVNSRGFYIALVADETRWRVYTAKENQGGLTFTYVSNLDYAAALVSDFARALSEEYEDLAAGNYHVASQFYDIGTISGIYEENGELKRHASYVRADNIAEGYSLDIHYGNYISDFERAARDLSAADAENIYGFTDDNSTEMRLEETPFYDLPDYVESLNDLKDSTWQVMLMLMGISSIGIAGIKSADERNSRRQLREYEKKKRQLRP
jgi:hypothetical protein